MWIKRGNIYREIVGSNPLVRSYDFTKKFPGNTVAEWKEQGNENWEIVGLDPLHSGTTYSYFEEFGL